MGDVAAVGGTFFDSCPRNFCVFSICIFGVITAGPLSLTAGLPYPRIHLTPCRQALVSFVKSGPWGSVQGPFELTRF